jgi:TonB family protein
MKIAVPSILAMLLLNSGVASPAQENTAAATPQSASPETYPDTKDGFQTFLKELVSAIRSNNSKQVANLIRSTAIPNDRQWFLSMYEPDKAESWIEPYEKELPKRQEEFKLLIEGLAKTDGELVLRKVNDDPQPGQGLEWGMLHSAKAPLDIYYAAWKTDATHDDRPVAIGYFYFIDGKFRWDSLVRIFPGPLAKPASQPAIVLQESPISGPVFKVGNGVLPPKLIQSTAAEYTDAARLARLEGSVVLSVIVDTDGRAKQVRVIRSLDGGLDEKAVEAVRTWQFAPATHDGQPVPVNMTIQVRFKLYDKK